MPGAIPTSQHSFTFARQRDYLNPYIQLTYFL